MPSQDAAAANHVDRLLGGRYRLVQPIARGGMAEVWEGHDEILTRPVAVKVLQPHLAEDESFVERFRREAVAAARLAHPSIVATYDAGIRHNGQTTAYIVMELVRGRTLRQLIASGPWASPAAPGQLAIPMAVGIGLQIADALTHAHAAGLVHRDIKPANVLVCEEDVWGVPRVKVTDFGIVKASDGVGLDLTRTGVVLGTPKYLSPEQIEGVEPDARADLYALGVVLFEMVAGAPPFSASSDVTVAMKHLQQLPARLRDVRPGVPLGLDGLVARLLAKRPEDRPVSAVEVRRTLAAIQTGASQAETMAVPPVSGPQTQAGRPADADPADAVRGPIAGPRSWSWKPAPPSAPPGTAPVPPAVAGPVGDRLWGAPDATDAPLRQPTGPRRTAPGGLRRDTEAINATGVAGPANRAGRRRSTRGPSILVAVLVVAASIATALLLSQKRSPSSGSAGGSGSASIASAKPVPVASYSEYLAPGDHIPDDPQGLVNAFDGNPATAWRTDIYTTPDFGRLYNGLGVAITLKKSENLAALQVTSPTPGWSAQVYVANQVGSPLSTWGPPVASQADINGSATFNLTGHSGRCLLLWITNLGPDRAVTINEITPTA